MKIINLLVGGPTDQWPAELKQGKIEGTWIGVDRGALCLINLGIIPAVVVGDFDSIDKTEFEAIKGSVEQVKVYPPEKDLTDTQIGVSTAIKHFEFDQLNIYGATGGRIDHLLANLFLVLDPQFSDYLDKIRLIDRQNTVEFYRPGKYAIRKESDKKYLAFVNLTKATGLTLIDEKYHLTNYDSDYPISWASNEFVGSVNHFSFKSGIIAVIQSKDEDSLAQ